MQAHFVVLERRTCDALPAHHAGRPDSNLTAMKLTAAQTPRLPHVCNDICSAMSHRPCAAFHTLDSQHTLLCRPTLGLMKGSARAQSDFAALAAAQPPQQQMAPQLQLPSSPCRQTPTKDDNVGCFGFWASR